MGKRGRQTNCLNQSPYIVFWWEKVEEVLPIGLVGKVFAFLESKREKLLEKYEGNHTTKES